MNKNTNMTEGNVLRVILMFTIPLFIGNLFQQVYNTVDSMIVGRYLGQNALAAVGSTGTVMFMINGLTSGLCTGFTVLTSQKFGENDKEGTKRSVANGMLLALIIIVCMTGFSLCIMSSLLTIIHTPKEIFQDAYTYIMIICVGILPNVAYSFFAGCLRAVGNSRVPLITLVISACVNVVLDYMFIRYCNMGVAGAAWATNIAMAVSAIICLLYILRKEPSITPKWSMFRLNMEYSKKQLAVGVPMALQFGITGFGTVIMQAAINLFGSAAVAAYTASTKITSLLMQGATSLGQTMATYAGQNYGAKMSKRIRKGVRCAISIVVVYSLAAAFISYFGLPYIVPVFFEKGTDMAPLLVYAKEYIGICACFYIPLGVIFTFRNTMQGCGYGFWPMMGGVVELVARLICAVIAMKTLIYTIACFCDAAAWLSAGIFTMVTYFFVMRKIEKEMQPVSLQ